jgi:hypothetical protein
MSEIGLVEIFSMGEAVALIGTLFVILYFSRKQAQSLSVDIETKVLNDLAERMHTQVEILIGRPQLTKVLSKVDAESPELAYAYDILFTYFVTFQTIF